MENRVQHILLKHRHTDGFRRLALPAIVLLYLGWASVAWADEGAGGAKGGEQTDAVQVILPEVQPREVTEDEIDDEFFEVGAFVGNLTIDNFGSEAVYGINASFHATEDFFLQANFGKSSAGLTSFEELTGEHVRLLTDSERDYTFYNLLLGYNIFPGEVFLTSNLTFNSSFYLVAGIGNTEFGGEDNFTTILGTGYRIVLRDWLTWHIDYRDHIFSSDILKKDDVTHNIEFTTGVTFFF